jgi:hypothetical protein
MAVNAARGVFQVPFHVTGTTAGNMVAYWTAPFDCTLLHVSAVASNDSDATLIVGDSGDTDEYLQSTTIGDSAVPTEFDGDDFVDTAGSTHTKYYPRIAAGTVVVVTVDYDGDSGTAANDLTVVLTLAPD